MKGVLSMLLLLCLAGCLGSPADSPPKVSDSAKLPTFLESQRDRLEGLGLLLTKDIRQVYRSKAGHRAFLLETAVEQGSRLNGRLSHRDIQWAGKALCFMPIFKESGEHLLSLLIGMPESQVGLNEDIALQVLLIQQSNIEHTGILTLKDGQLEALIQGNTLKGTTVLECLAASFGERWEEKPTEEALRCFANFGPCFWARVADCSISAGEVQNILK